MTQQQEFMLVNPNTGNFVFRIFDVDDCPFADLQRHNCYLLILIKEGRGKVKANFSEYEFAENSLFAFSPYQPFRFISDEKITGSVLQFHPDFYCIYMHQKEVACNGVLFNNIYDPPLTQISPADTCIFDMLLMQMRKEVANPALAQQELLVSYLKIFLITASRIKTEQQSITPDGTDSTHEPQLLQNLKDAIELHYKNLHAPAEYAELLKVPLTTLARVTKQYFNKTLSKLIAERIVIEAKRELYLSDKTIKEIAYGLGYPDEYYFSRFFKVNADVSPQIFRETVGFGKIISG